jgi:hypothetical protein
MNSKNCVARTIVKGRPEASSRLSCSSDGEGQAGGLEQAFLQQLGAEVAAAEHLVGAHHGQRQQVPHARCARGSDQVQRGRAEEVERRLVLERKRIAYVHHHLSAGQGWRQALAGEDVHPRARRGGDHLVAVPAQARDDLGSDAAGAADDDEFHADPWVCRWARENRSHAC